MHGYSCFIFLKIEFRFPIVHTYMNKIAFKNKNFLNWKFFKICFAFLNANANCYKQDAPKHYLLT